MKRLFTGPDMTTGLNVFLDAQHRLFVWHAVESFNHLGATSTKSENESTIGDVVTTSSGHRHQRWCTTEHIQNASTDFDRVGFGS